MTGTARPPGVTHPPAARSHDDSVAPDQEDAGHGIEDRYFATNAAHASELDRLVALEEIHDPATIRRLERTGVRSGWACLEVAAGAGSIAAWLGNRVGSGGRVLAVDINTRFLGHLGSPVEARAMNVLTDDLEPGAFDLVHARAILMHLGDPEAALAKMAAAVKPGGWLLVEEAGSGGGIAVVEGHPEAELAAEDFRSILERHNQSRGRRASNIGIRLRPLLENFGFEDVVAEGVSEIWRGGEGLPRFADMTLSAFRNAGIATDEEYERLARLARDPSFYFQYGPVYGASGRRPS